MYSKKSLRNIAKCTTFDLIEYTVSLWLVLNSRLINDAKILEILINNIVEKPIKGHVDREELEFDVLMIPREWPIILST
ncbi:MAG: hypothetical protein QW101_06870 [Ignisphaera sp.]|uniref:Uncharacterized protein n=1 Tax=Ignisphaera aggregans TaxID=334771 RepID=A0A7J3MZD3_9CREN